MDEASRSSHNAAAAQGVVVDKSRLRGVPELNFEIWDVVPYDTRYGWGAKVTGQTESNRLGIGGGHPPPSTPTSLARSAGGRGRPSGFPPTPWQGDCNPEPPPIPSPAIGRGRARGGGGHMAKAEGLGFDANPHLVLDQSVLFSVEFAA